MPQTKATTSTRSPCTSRGGLLTAKQLSDVSVPLGLVLAKKSIESFSKKTASTATAKKPTTVGGKTKRGPSPAQTQAIAERNECESTCRATYATTMQAAMKTEREESMKRKEGAVKKRPAKLNDKPEQLKKREADRAAKEAKDKEAKDKKAKKMEEMEEMRKKKAAAKAAREAKKMPAPTNTA